jgi:hypothetical protein
VRNSGRQILGRRLLTCRLERIQQSIAAPLSPELFERLEQLLPPRHSWLDFQPSS